MKTSIQIKNVIKGMIIDVKLHGVHTATLRLKLAMLLFKFAGRIGGFKCEVSVSSEEDNKIKFDGDSHIIEVVIKDLQTMGKLHEVIKNL